MMMRSATADPGFQVRGAHLKKLRRAEGGANISGVFRVKNHDFTPKNLIFFAKHTAEVERGNTGCLGIRIMCPSGATGLPTDCCFSELAL
jgi:hypothetical protein